MARTTGGDKDEERGIVRETAAA
ncbi:protein of unknown function (plasmid) [Caballeronia sp. S22]